jgi:hypothetical protein
MIEPGGLGRRISRDLAGLTLASVKDACFTNARANATAIAAGKSVLALRETPLMQRTTALVIAAGPSLYRHKVIERLKVSAYNGVIIATESGLSFCLRHNIIPDLIVTVDPDDSNAIMPRIVRWFGDPNLTAQSLEKDDYFSRQDMDPLFNEDELRANAELLTMVNRYGPQIKICMASCASPLVVRRASEAGMDIFWWNPMLDDDDAPGSLTRQLHQMNGLPCINAGGNVGTACWVMAHAVLGKQQVGLLGLDFAYYNDTPYFRTQYYKEIIDLVGPDRLDEVFVRIHNPHVGCDFYTDPAYLWYRDCFLEMAQSADCETINCTGGGILFGPGVNCCSFEDFIQRCR